MKNQLVNIKKRTYIFAPLRLRGEGLKAFADMSTKKALFVIAELVNHGIL